MPAFHSNVPTLAALVSNTRFGPIGMLKTTLVAGLGPVLDDRRLEIDRLSSDHSRCGGGEKHIQIDRRGHRGRSRDLIIAQIGIELRSGDRRRERNGANRKQA